MPYPFSFCAASRRLRSGKRRSASSGSTYGGAFNAANSDEGIGVWSAGGKYDFYADTENGSSFFRGKIGIGKGDPACKLHIKQAGNNFQSGLRLERSNNSNWWSIQINHLDDLVFDFNGSETRAWIDDTNAD